VVHSKHHDSKNTNLLVHLKISLASKKDVKVNQKFINPIERNNVFCHSPLCTQHAAPPVGNVIAHHKSAGDLCGHNKKCDWDREHNGTENGPETMEGERDAPPSKNFNKTVSAALKAPKIPKATVTSSPVT
jgi:hypothetical protein